MAVFVFRDGQFVDKRTGQPMLSAEEMARPPSVVHVVSDIPDYRSPIDGRPITSRSQRREDLKRNNCVEYEPSLSPTKGKREFRNAEFCKKRGLQVAERFR
jgi:hypothetical protein